MLKLKYVVSIAIAIIFILVALHVVNTVRNVGEFRKYLGPPSVLLAREAAVDLGKQGVSPDVIDRLCLGWELRIEDVRLIMEQDSLPAWILIFNNRNIPMERILDACKTMNRADRMNIRDRIMRECEGRGYGHISVDEKERLEIFASDGGIDNRRPEKMLDE